MCFRGDRRRGRTRDVKVGEVFFNALDAGYELLRPSIARRLDQAAGECARANVEDAKVLRSPPIRSFYGIPCRHADLAFSSICCTAYLREQVDFIQKTT